jgi:hypothetical protein
MRALKLVRVVLGLGLLAAFGLVLAVPAGGVTIPIPGSSPPVVFTPLGPPPTQPAVCTGTDAAPGQLAGMYPNGVVIWGTCWVNGGIAQVDGNVSIEPGSTLNASFALNDQNHGVGTSALYVTGNIYIDGGGTLILGCEPNHSPCTDDPAAASGGTLSTLDIVSGDVVASDPLGVIIHHSIIGGNVTQLGGGGGVSCVPTGVFAAELHSPVFSDLEDNWIVGDVTIAGLRTCWNGALRNYVGGDFTSTDNVFADPDANEVLSNVIQGDLACAGNSPVVEYGDSHASPDKVFGSASGECSFSTYQPNPAPNGPLMPIAVPG